MGDPGCPRGHVWVTTFGAKVSVCKNCGAHQAVIPLAYNDPINVEKRKQGVLPDTPPPMTPLETAKALSDALIENGKLRAEIDRLKQMTPIDRMKQQAESLPPTPRAMPINLPNIPIDRPATSAADGERWAILSQARTIIETAFQDAGYRLIGSGFGMRSNSYGETDIGLEYAGHKVEVRAYLPKAE